MAAVWFIVLVGVLIFVHELGHFAWAKFFGVRVQTFSLGFGPRIAGFRRGNTDYIIAAIPLGGYVRMLGEDPSESVAPREAAQSFHHQPLWKRFVIVMAGPAMNLLFPVLLYFVVFLGDAHVAAPVIGTVFAGRPAAGRLLPGDEVLSINGQSVSTFHEITRTVEANAGVPLAFTVRRGHGILNERITPVMTEVRKPLDLVDRVGRIGIMPEQPAAVIGVSGPDSAAAQAGLRTFDRVVAIGGKTVDRWHDLEMALNDNHGALALVTYLRPQRAQKPLGGFIELETYEPHVATLTPLSGSGSGAARSGLESADLYVSHVSVGSPEHAMGILPGDRLVALDGETLPMWSMFLERLETDHGRAHMLRWRRGAEEREAPYALEHQVGMTSSGQPYDRYIANIRNWVPMGIPSYVETPSRLAYAASESLRNTKEMIELTFYSIVRLLQGRVSVKSIGGPLSIMEVAGSAAREGTLNYLTLMAFISVNLGLINLLPIPMLDGGHLLFFALEGVGRRRIGQRVRQTASLVGFVVLLVIMGIAIKNDIDRRWHADETDEATLP